MINSSAEKLEREFAFNAGWNQAALLWDENAHFLDEPVTSLTGGLQESFNEGFRASQDELIIARAERRKGIQKKYF